MRELAHAARLDLSRPYRNVRAEDLTKIFSSVRGMFVFLLLSQLSLSIQARKIHPYLSRFENDWATAEILKQYLSSVRRYGRRKGYFNCAAEARQGCRRRNLDDMFDKDDN